MSNLSDGIKFKCQCGVILRVKTGGGVITCPKCHNQTKVPSPIAAPPRTGSGNNQSDGKYRDLSRTPPVLPKASSGPKKLLILGGAVFLLVILGGVSFGMIWMGISKITPGDPQLTRYILPDFVAALSIHPARMLKNPLVAKQIPPGTLDMVPKEVPLKPEELERILVLVHQVQEITPDKEKGKGKENAKGKGKGKSKDAQATSKKQGGGMGGLDLGFPAFSPGTMPGGALIVKASKPIPEKEWIQFQLPGEKVKQETLLGKTLYLFKNGPKDLSLTFDSFAICFPEPTVVLQGEERLVRKMLEGVKNATPLGLILSNPDENSDISLHVGLDAFKPQLSQFAQDFEKDIPPEFKEVPKLLGNLSALSLSLDLSGKDLFKIRVDFEDENSVKIFQDLTKKGLALALKSWKEMKPFLESQTPAQAKDVAVPLFAQIDKGLEIKMEGKALTLTLPRPEKLGK